MEVNATDCQTSKQQIFKLGEVIAADSFAVEDSLHYRKSIYQMVREDFQEKMLNLHRHVIELKKIKKKAMSLNTQKVNMGQQCTFACLEITM
jgi:hypothetical protein